MIQQWTKGDPSSVAALAYDLLSFPECNSCITSYSYRDVTDPKSLSPMKFFSNYGQTYLMTNFMFQWATQDWQAALSWTEQLPKGQLAADLAYTGMMTALAREDPPKAWDFWKNTFGNLSSDKQGSNYYIIKEWMNRDYQELTQSIKQLPEGKLKDFISRTIISELAKKDFKSACQWIDSLSAGSIKENVIEDITKIDQFTENTDGTIEYIMIHKDLPLIREWLLNMKENSEARGQGLAHVMICLKKDPIMIAHDLAQLPSGKTREAAYRTLAHYWIDQNPQAVMDWAETLKNKKLQKEIFEKAMAQQIIHLNKIEKLRPFQVSREGMRKYDIVTITQSLSNAMSSREIPEAYREGVLNQIIQQNFQRNDRQTLMESLQNFPDGPVKDRLLNHYVYSNIRTPDLVELG